MSDLILASGSPRRKLLLGYLGLNLEIHPANIDETPVKNENPIELVKRLSTLKAEASFASWQGSALPLIAADTIVVLDNKILGKPKDKEHAITMWKQLSGRFHEVITGYTIIAPTKKRIINYVTSKVLFKRLDHDEMLAYLKTNEWKDKAGGYALQGISGMWVKEIQGSYTNVIGLPLTEVASDLRKLMNWPPFPW